MQFNNSTFTSSTTDEYGTSLSGTDSLVMFKQETVSTAVEVYLDEPIRELPYYRELIHYMRCMQATDSLTIWVDTPGGDLSATLGILDAMENTAGEVKVVVSGEASSAGSIIALSADSLSIGSRARFMLHSASYSVDHMKQGDIESRVENNKSLLKSVIEVAYADFLTQDEMQLLYIGKDYYMDSAEVIRRLDLRESIRVKRTECKDISTKKVKLK